MLLLIATAWHDGAWRAAPGLMLLGQNADSRAVVLQNALKVVDFHDDPVHVVLELFDLRVVLLLFGVA